jgi:hypothetical protein
MHVLHFYDHQPLQHRKEFKCLNSKITYFNSTQMLNCDIGLKVTIETLNKINAAFCASGINANISFKSLFPEHIFA